MSAKIAPSVLAADFSRLADHVRAVESGGADQLHVDVMDGHFVPNLSMGPLVVEALKRCTRLPLDVHLMITEPGRYFAPFVEAGADHISFHIEVAPEPLQLIDQLRSLGVGVGVAVNPETSIDPVLEIADRLDMVVVMTVHPGFGGQSFLAANLDKVRALRDWEVRSGFESGRLEIEVDGGIDVSTGPRAAEAGASTYVAGSSVFRAPDPARAVRDLRRAIEG